MTSSFGAAFPELFDDSGRLFKQVDSLVRKTNGAVRSFAVDLREYSDHYLILADLPGLQKDQIELTKEGSELALEVKRASADTQCSSESQCSEAGNETKVACSSDTPTGKVLHRERAEIAGRRVVRLPDDAEDVIEARLEVGVLSVKVSKRPELQPKKIEIS
jgi:HSP20 family protein